jgi:hypothetical protein
MHANGRNLHSHLSPAAGALPARVSVALTGAINLLQDELDALRLDVWRAFTVRAGHG